jgi:hypothetical protein
MDPQCLIHMATVYQKFVKSGHQNFYHNQVSYIIQSKSTQQRLSIKMLYVEGLMNQSSSKMQNCQYSITEVEALARDGTFHSIG